MLQVSEVRSKDGRTYPPDLKEFKPGEALSYILEVYMNPGGIVQELSPTKLVLAASVFETEDIATITGSTEEMAFLVKFCQAWLQVMVERRDQLSERMFDHFHRLYQQQPIHPIFAATHAKMVSGIKLSRACLILALAETKNAAAILLELRPKELIAVAELHLETGKPVEQILAELEMAANG